MSIEPMFADNFAIPAEYAISLLRNFSSQFPLCVEPYYMKKKTFAYHTTIL